MKSTIPLLPAQQFASLFRCFGAYREPPPRNWCVGLRTSSGTCPHRTASHRTANIYMYVSKVCTYRACLREQIYRTSSASCLTWHFHCSFLRSSASLVCRSKPSRSVKSPSSAFWGCRLDCRGRADRPTPPPPPKIVAAKRRR